MSTLLVVLYLWSGTS